jgi:ubiquinone/menaquinone biosynthesis C-methylase UbiE
MTDGTPADVLQSPEFGNLEANDRFVEETRLLSPSVRVLEIGSGRGGMLHLLRSRGYDVLGVDISAERIAEAQRRFQDLPIEQTNGTVLPFPDASFDVVLSFDVFEHIADTDAHLEEVRRVLRPGGWYLLQTPNKWTNAVFETIRWRSFTRWKADHCSLHTKKQLRRRLTRHRFHVAFDDVAVVTPFFRAKVRQYLGPVGAFALAVINPDRLPGPFRTNFYVRAYRGD